MALIVVAVLYGATVHDEGHGVSAWIAVIVGLASGAGIVAVLTRALRRGSRNAVAPAILLQLMSLGEAYNMAQEQRWSYAVIVGFLAAGALVSTALGLRQMPAGQD